MLLSCDDAWFGGWRGPSILGLDAGRLSYRGSVDAPGAGDVVEAHVSGIVLAPFTDSHVHLGLIDPTQLRGGGIGRVVDLGWDPAIAATWPETGASDPTWPEVTIAGGLVGPTGGYPSRSAWAPAAAALAVDDVEAAETTIDGLRDAGASVVKITLNSDVGPVWDDTLLVEVVALAHARGLPVVAHAQGIGQARRAARARVDALAHTPFTERLDDDLLDDVARSMTWISTLDIHGHGRYDRGYDIAVDNLARFHSRGGTVLYGTDLGNGALPVGLNGRELASLARAGLDLTAILRALTPGSGDPTFDTRIVMILDGPRPTELDDLRRLGDATAVTLPDLVRRSE